MNFFFVTLFQGMATGTGGPLVKEGSAINVAAMMILAVVFLVSVYEAFVGGGSMRSLFVALVKTAACGLMIENWSAVFLDVTAAFTSLASGIIGSGGQHDFMWVYGHYLSDAYTSSNLSITSLLSGTAIPVLISSALGLIVLVVYYVAMVIIEFIYCAWGMILMCIGPLMLALLPSKATSGFAKEWIKNFFEWAAWPVLFAIIAMLAMSAGTNVSSNMFMTNVGLGTGASAGATFAAAFENDVLALLYCCMMILLPFLASALMKGSFNGAYIAMQKVESMVKNAAALATGNFGALAANTAAAGASKAEGGAWGAIGASAAAGNPVMASAPPASPKS